MTLRLTVVADTATPALAKCLARLKDQAPILDAMGRRVARDTSQHISQWGQSHPNKLGGRPANYWVGIAAKINSSTALEVNGHAATVTLGSSEMPGLMRAFGDITIVPGTKTPGVKYIPIPARSESYGARPAEFGAALVLFWRGKGQPGGLAQAVAVTRRKNTKNGNKGSTYFRPGLVFYWFKDRVTQPQDRSLLPSAEEWSASAGAGATDWLDQHLETARKS
jgi:hypothetical protein